MMEASLSPKKNLLFLEGTSLDPLSFIQQILFKHLVCATHYIKNQGCNDWEKASSWTGGKENQGETTAGKKSLKFAGTEVQDVRKVRGAL